MVENTLKLSIKSGGSQLHSGIDLVESVKLNEMVTHPSGLSMLTMFWGGTCPTSPIPRYQNPPTTIAPNERHINSSSHGQGLGDSVIGKAPLSALCPGTEGRTKGP
jgi:hypothetical protein